MKNARILLLQPFILQKLEGRVTGKKNPDLYIECCHCMRSPKQVCTILRKRRKNEKEILKKGYTPNLLFFLNFAIASLKSLVSSCCWFALHRPQYRQCGPVGSIISQPVLAHLMLDPEVSRSLFLSSNATAIDLFVKKP